MAITHPLDKLLLPHQPFHPATPSTLPPSLASSASLLACSSIMKARKSIPHSHSNAVHGTRDYSRNRDPVNPVAMSADPVNPARQCLPRRSAPPAGALPWASNRSRYPHVRNVGLRCWHRSASHQRRGGRCRCKCPKSAQTARSVCMQRHFGARAQSGKRQGVVGFHRERTKEQCDRGCTQKQPSTTAHTCNALRAQACTKTHAACSRRCARAPRPHRGRFHTCAHASTRWAE